MSGKIEKVFVVSDVELGIMMAIKGIEEGLGFEFPTKSITEEEMVSALHEMVRKKMITASEDSFSLSSEYDAFIAYISYAMNYFIVYPGDERYSKSIGFPGSRILVERLSPINPGIIRFSYLDYEELGTALLEQGYLPKVYIEDGREAEWVQGDPVYRTPEWWLEKEASMVLEKRSHDGDDPLFQMVVYKKEEIYEIAVYGEKGCRHRAYTNQVLENVLQEMLEA